NSQKGMFTIRMTASDSVLARDLVLFYVDALSERVRTDVMHNAESDRRFLEDQLNTITDPTLREKTQSMIATQIERAMLVRSRVFDVVEAPSVPMQRESPKKKKIVILAFL